MVWSNWKPIAHRASGRIGDITPTGAHHAPDPDPDTYESLLEVLGAQRVMRLSLATCVWHRVTASDVCDLATQAGLQVGSANGGRGRAPSVNGKHVDCWTTPTTGWIGSTRWLRRSTSAVRCPEEHLDALAVTDERVPGCLGRPGAGGVGGDACER
jgi:hypothetical protein